MPEDEWLRAALQKLTRGLAVVIDDADIVAAGRAAFRDFDNVLFVPEDPTGTLPWTDGFFTKIIAPQMSREMERVLGK